MRSVFVFDCTNPISRQKAQTLANGFLNRCYPPSLVLKEEELESQNECMSYRFLESKIITERNVTTVQHWNKNIDDILAHGRQKFLNIQHARSFGNRDTKRGVLISRVLAIDRMSSNDGLKLQGVVNLFIELILLGYSTRMLKQVCRNMYRRSQSPIWKVISKHFTR